VGSQPSALVNLRTPECHLLSVSANASLIRGKHIETAKGDGLFLRARAQMPGRLASRSLEQLPVESGLLSGLPMVGRNGDGLA
jgi:hypothetical protein